MRIGDYYRNRMIEEIFAAGYGSRDEHERNMIRWTKEEMAELCDDEGLLSLFQRYTTYPNIEDKISFEQEVLAEIAIHQLFVS